MLYKAIGVMSGSSLDGLDIAYVHLNETAGKWSFEIVAASCYPYASEWVNQLSDAVSLTARDYQLLHTKYGKYIGEQVNRFINEHDLYHQVDLVGSHGHTTFHSPEQHMTGQLGDGAAIAACTELPVVSDLRAMDVAFGGQGAPIVPIGEKLLLQDYSMLLNLGGIANLSFRQEEKYIAFDVCAASRVLNMLAAEAGKEFDEGGKMAASGKLSEPLLHKLSELDYYTKAYPKSLANQFGTEVVYPLIQSFHLATPDALHTYVAHIVQELDRSVRSLLKIGASHRMLVTGGGALNNYLVAQLRSRLSAINVETVVPDRMLIDYKEAMIMALMGVLRWREEYNVLASVTGAKRNSIGGALWLGTEA